MCVLGLKYRVYVLLTSEWKWSIPHIGGIPGIVKDLLCTSVAYLLTGSEIKFLKKRERERENVVTGVDWQQKQDGTVSGDLAESRSEVIPLCAKEWKAGRSQDAIKALTASGKISKPTPICLQGKKEIHFW